jgi:hypothetical protein
MKERLKDSALIASIVCMLFLLALRTCESKKHAINYPDSINYYKNELGQEVAKREALTLDVSELKKLSNSKDELIVRLVNEAKKKGVTNVVGVNMKTKFDTILKTLVIRDSADPCNPIYKDSIVNEWIDLRVTAKHDSSELKLLVKNKLNISVTEEKKRTLVEVTQLNPYSHTSDLQSISIKKKKPNKGLKIAALVAAFLAGILIAK